LPRGHDPVVHQFHDGATRPLGGVTDDRRDRRAGTHMTVRREEMTSPGSLLRRPFWETLLR
jgi:hypothetical protein